MKRGVLLFLIGISLMLILPFVCGLSVTLIQPNDGVTYATNTTKVTFGCVATSASAHEGINNITLYLNFDSDWRSQNYTVTAEVGLTQLSFQHTFVNLTTGTYTWNCLATAYENETYYDIIPLNEVVNKISAFASANRTLTVTLTPPGPTYTTIPDMTWLEDTMNSSLNLSSYFTNPAGGHNMNYTASTSTDLTILINANKIVNITPSADWYGSAYIYFNATYGDATTKSNTINITVTGVNDAPTFSGPIFNLTWHANTNYSSLDLEGYFSDADHDVLNYYSSTPENILITIDDDGDVTLSPNPGFVGVESIVFYVTDSVNEASSNNVTVNVTVPQAATNNAPIITNSSHPAGASLNLDAGQTITFSISKTDAEGGTLTVQWLVDGMPASGAVSDSFTYAATAGTHSVQVDVSDGSLTTSRSWTVITPQAGGDLGTPPIGGDQVGQGICGDGIVQENEDCQTCAQDVKCEENENCEQGVCVKKSSSLMLTVMIIVIIVILLAVVGGVVYFLKTRSVPVGGVSAKPSISTGGEIKFPSPAPAQQPKPSTISTFVESPQKQAQPYRSAQPLQKPASPVASYIQKMRDLGHSEAEIRVKLKEKGWSDEQIEKALKES